MKWQKVHTVNDYWDGPRFGVADYDGQPHIYESAFDDFSDDCPDTYRLSPIEPELFDLIRRDWAIWEKWLAEFKAGRVAKSSHPCLPGDKPEQEKIKEQIGDRFQIDPAGCLRKKAEFRQVSGSPRRLEVKWTDCESV